MIQKLEKEDLNVCAEMYVETFNGPPWFDLWTYDRAYKRLLDIYNTPGYLGWIYLENNAIKAAVFGHLEYWYEGMMYNLKEMYVQSSEKGKGMGSKLLHHLEQELCKHQVHSVLLFTSIGDLTEKFYVNNGYEPCDDMSILMKKISKT